MSSVPLLYRVAIRVLRHAAPLVAFGGSKVARGVRGRRGALETLAGWATRERDPARPTVWFHAPSVGEGLQAGAVVSALTALQPELQVVHTHFSPSAEGLGRRIGADVSAYLPWDVAESTGRALELIRPRVLVFTKTEVWPVLTEEAGRRGIPVALVGGTVGESAGRLRRPARAVLRDTWARLTLACACTSEDAERLVGLGVVPSAVRVTGDPGIDSAVTRAEAADPRAPHLAPFHAARRPVVVAGSTWPADEAVLLRAWEPIERSDPGALLVVAPHEPTRAHVGSLLDRLRGSGLTTVTVGEVERNGSVDGVHAVIVDRTGILAELYTVASIAFVGGGYGGDGLHSVLEPAAAGVPVVFGPGHEDSRAAGDLLERGAAEAAEDADALERAVKTWLWDSAARRWASEHALAYIGAHRGAAERTAELLEPLIRKPVRAPEVQ